MSQDLSEHYSDKSKRVQQKLDNLRKMTSGRYKIYFSLMQSMLL